MATDSKNTFLLRNSKAKDKTDLLAITPAKLNSAALLIPISKEQLAELMPQIKNQGAYLLSHRRMKQVNYITFLAAKLDFGRADSQNTVAFTDAQWEAIKTHFVTDRHPAQMVTSILYF